MNLKSMTVGQIGVMREVTYDLRSALEKMQKITPNLRLDMSQFPRIVIDVEQPNDIAPVETLKTDVMISLDRFKASVSPYVADLDPDPEQDPDFDDIEIPAAASSPDSAGLHGGDAVTSPPIAKPDRLPAPNWSQAEDDLAIKLHGEGLGIEDIAVKLNRPLEGTKYRFKNKLKERAEQVRVRPKYERAPYVAPVKVVVVAPPALIPPPHVTAIGLSVVQAAISQRLDKLGYRDGHTAQRDLELVQRLTKGGEKLSMIAADWGSDTRMLKNRFADLCGIETPSPDLQANVLDALKARAAWVG